MMTAAIAAKEANVHRLCAKFHVKELYVFGSATGDEYDPRTSDLDFLVSFGECTPAENADRYFGLLAALEDLFGRRVDLIELEAITNPYFQREVEATRVPIYAA